MTICTTLASSLTAVDRASNMVDENLLEPRTTQNISGRYINRSKLTAMLRIKFGLGAYDIYVSRIIHNVKAQPLQQYISKPIAR